MGIRRIMNIETAETLRECFPFRSRTQPHEMASGLIIPKPGGRLSDLYMEFPPVNDRAIWFNGCSSHVSLPSVVLIPDSSYTIEFWVYLYSEHDFQRVFIQGDIASPSFQVVIIQYGDDIVLLDGPTSSVPFRCAVTGLYNNEWMHIAFTKNSTGPVFKSYKDGNDVTTLSHAVNSAGSGGGNYFGCREGERDFGECGLCEFRIWNTVRTQQQIQDNMYKNVSPSEPGLTGYWKLNDGGATVVDSTINSNDGTTQNEVAWLPPRG